MTKKKKGLISEYLSDISSINLLEECELPISNLLDKSAASFNDYYATSVSDVMREPELVADVINHFPPSTVADLISRSESLAGLARGVFNNPVIDAVNRFNIYKNPFDSFASDYAAELRQYTDVFSSSTVLKLAGQFDSTISSLINNPMMNEVELLNQRVAEFASPLAADFLNKQDCSISAFLSNTAIQEANRLQEQLTQICPPEAVDFIDQHQASISSLFNDPFIEQATLESKRLKNIIANGVIDFAEVKDLAINNLFSDSVFNIAQHHSEQISHLIDTTALSGFYGLEESLKLATLSALDFATSYYSENVSDSDNEELVEFKQSIENGSKRHFTSESFLLFYISTLLSILMFLYSLESGEESNKQLNENIEAVETTILSQVMLVNQQLSDVTEKLDRRDNQDNLTKYVVKRAVKLRSKNSTKPESKVISVLYTNQVVELLKRDGKWIYVAYYDHLDDIPRTGWVYKKYLKMIK